MSGRTAAALCLAAHLVAAGAPWEWMTDGWSALAAVEEPPPSADSDDEPEVEPGGEEGWLIDPNG